MESVLFVSPTWVNIHSDIIKWLQKLGYRVEFIPEYDFSSDPFRVKPKHPESSEAADLRKTNYWKEKLGELKTGFDYLLVVDGLGVNSFLFEELKRRNPAVYRVNYLYDTTYSMYHFERNFHFYDRVATFDRSDAERYGIELLPIYWMKSEGDEAVPRYGVFGFGAYSPSRMRFFSQVADIVKKCGMSHFIKVYHKKIDGLFRYEIRLLVRKLLGMPQLMSVREYRSEMVSTDLIPPDRYRGMIEAADIVLDTKVQVQDGLTARFMWALGAGKKIITTNDAVKRYAFCSGEQVLVVRDKIFDEREKAEIIDFITSRKEIPDAITAGIEQFRIDYWLKNLLCKKPSCGQSTQTAGEHV